MIGERLTRQKVATLLGVSVSYVKNLLDGKYLTPSKNEYGRVVYLSEEVQNIRKAGWKGRTRAYQRVEKPKLPREAGELAATVFELIQQGHALTQIVIATHADPSVVRRLWREYTLSFQDGERAKREEEQTRELNKNYREEMRLRNREIKAQERALERRRERMGLAGPPAPAAAPATLFSPTTPTTPEQ